MIPGVLAPVSITTTTTSVEQENRLGREVLREGYGSSRTEAIHLSNCHR